MMLTAMTTDAAPPEDQASFDALLARHRRALHLFCYRLLASYSDAEDVVQEAQMRAWCARTSYDAATGEVGFRRWLYRIATNAALDFLKRAARKVSAGARSFAEVPWLQPYPDRVLDELPAGEAGPDATAAGKESLALGYLALIQLLPPQQRAVFVLREVLDWSAQETAAALDVTVAAANSALQRARDTVARHADAYPTPRVPTDDERRLLAAYISTHQGQDVDACIAIMGEHIRVTMPPHPDVFESRDALIPLMRHAFADFGEWRLLPVWANRQPAAVCYLRRPGDTLFRPFKIDVLRVGSGGVIDEITTFDAALLTAFGCPEVLS